MKNMFFRWSIFLISSLLLTAFSTGSSLQPAERLMPSTVQLTPCMHSYKISESIERPASNPNFSQQISVVYASNGEIKLWDETSNQSQTLFSSGDVISLWVSDDSQRIAFIRCSEIRQSHTDIYASVQQSELWVIDRNGENPRQLMTAERLRTFLETSEKESSGFYQVEWIPHTHDLLFSGINYFAQMWTQIPDPDDQFYKRIPQGVFRVETDTGSITTLSTRSLLFSASPDGREIALMSTSGLSFINTNGSNYRPDLLTFPFSRWAKAYKIRPSYGVWTKDNRAFLMSSVNFHEPETVVTLVYTDGSSVETLARLPYSGNPVIYSPDGKYAAVRDRYRAWHITTLDFEVGPLAIPFATKTEYETLLWAPSGDAYMLTGGELSRLCPDGILSFQRCEFMTKLNGLVVDFIWVDSSTFLYQTTWGRDIYFYRPASKHLEICRSCDYHKICVLLGDMDCPP